MNKIKRQEIFERFRANIDKPRSDLVYESNFELLIAVILSAQATDVSVNQATARLYPKANTPEQILALGEEGLKEYIKQGCTTQQYVAISNFDRALRQKDKPGDKVIGNALQAKADTD